MRHRPVLSLGKLLSAKTRPLCAQVTVVMAAGATRDCAAASRFLFLSTVGNHGLLPLLFTPAEYPIKARARARVLNARLALCHRGNDCLLVLGGTAIAARIPNSTG